MASLHFSVKDAKQIDLVVYLGILGYHHNKVRGQDYWYLSPFRDEKTPSFKVNRSRKIWFDFGEGKGGDIIDFGTRYFNCSVSELLERLSKIPASHNLLFHPPPPVSDSSWQQPSVPISLAGEKKEPGGGKILMLAQRPLASTTLLQYIEKRCIPVAIAQQYCREVDFELYDKTYTVIGFQNDKAGLSLGASTSKEAVLPKRLLFLPTKAMRFPCLKASLISCPSRLYRVSILPYKQTSWYLIPLPFSPRRKT